MKKNYPSILQNSKYAIAGLFIQIIHSAILIGISISWSNKTLLHVMWHAIAPIPVWLFLIFIFNYSNVPVDNKIFPDKRKPGTSIKDIVLRHGSVIAGLSMAAVLLQSLPAMAEPIFITTGKFSGVPNDIALLLFTILAFLTFLQSIFFMRLSDHHESRIFRSGAHYLISLTFFLIILLIKALCEYFNINFLAPYIEHLLAAINTILAIELVFSILLSFIQPNLPDNKKQIVFQSYILGIISHPKDIGSTIKSMVQDIFGFDISTLALVVLLKKIILPAAIISILSMILLSCIVIVRPGENALIVQFGKIHRSSIGAGLHIKAPYPISKVRRQDVDIVRQIHVGSHQPQTPGGTVFKEGVPLLWTTSHGLQHDELLIVSSPKELISNAIESGGKLDAVHDKTPSVSLAGADVVIEYVIRNFENYSSIYSKPEEMLNIISKSEVSRFVLSFDIDMLLSQGRAQMAQVLKDRIQKNCDNLSLGIKILNVAITAVHPPTDIADAFEENVSALQERETKIQQARQSASRAQIETAGSVESFASLSQQINNEEDSSGKNHIETEKMIWNCGGQISRILSDATGYRWSRENTECGKTEKFIEELKLYKIAKKVYFYERYLSVLEEALATKKKFLLSDSLRNTLIDVGTNVGRNTGSAINDFKNTF